MPEPSAMPLASSARLLIMDASQNFAALLPPSRGDLNGAMPNAVAPFGRAHHTAPALAFFMDENAASISPALSTRQERRLRLQRRPPQTSVESAEVSQS